ncbi:MFS transporter [Sinomonas sp. P10A9]|uniref:MFS transporter n=1 Tax=Sinomonas puerhi TaxID=3238584 RepID=A0AB39L775_9MICC
MARSGGALAVLRTVALTAVTVSPTFLMGSMAVQIRQDIDLGPAGIGIGAAVMFGVGGLLAPLSGALVERAGPRAGMAGAALLTSVALLGMASATDFGNLAAALAVAGAANALGQPATNIGLSRAIVPHRLGTALGAKQASIPTASLLGGLAVPMGALAVGWRWMFVSAAAIALFVGLWNWTRALAAAPAPSVPTGGSVPRAGTSRPAMVLFSCGGGLAAAAATSLGIFLVDSAVSSGISPGMAGGVFAAVAAIGLLARVAAGALIDARPLWSPYLLVAAMLVVGSVGFGFLAVGSPWGIAAGALFAYGAGWAWPGLMHYGVVRGGHAGVGRATGYLQIGLSLGAACGPLAFGLISEEWSYGASWALAGVALAGSAAVIAVGNALDSRSHPTQP